VSHADFGVSSNGLQNIDFKAEVVELADTPSDTITLTILYKLLIMQLLRFALGTSSEPPKDGQ
jgi:hypothetical protein